MTKTKNTSATNPRQKTRKVATKKRKATTKKENIDKNVPRSSPVRFAFVPIVQQFRKHTKKNDARLWIPIETSLLVRYEFASCSLQTRYIFVAIVLFCGANGIDEIPLDAKFMSSVLVADERTITKSFEELLSKNLLLEREKEREEKKKTDRQTNGVCVSDFNFSQDENQNQIKEVFNNGLTDANGNGNKSAFNPQQIQEYLNICINRGDSIQNPAGLAKHLLKSGDSDSFIRAVLHPERLTEIEQVVYAEPIPFTDLNCSVCFGAGMADADGKGYRSCLHCKNERGTSTGLEPVEEGNDEAI